MQIRSIQLENFRSWGKYSLELSDITILIGQNGVGKTNILEAIWFCCSGRSWRAREDRELIQWDKDYARIVTEIKNNFSEINIYLPRNTEVESAKRGSAASGKKQLKLDGVKHRFLDILGVMPAVLFSPETIQLIDGSPGLRRKFIDIILSQIERKYAVTLLEYNKIIRERNRLLYHIKMGKSKPDELDFWDDKLVELGDFIIQQREELIKNFNKNIAVSYQAIAGPKGGPSGDKEELKIKYHPAVERDRFADILVATREGEIQQTATTHGPHRDDFKLYLNNKDIATFGSRGEYRSAVLALKMVELAYLKDKTKENPILLLDDIFSELDNKRRMHLAKIVQGQQTIITTTDLDHIEKGLREKAKIVGIK